VLLEALRPVADELVVAVDSRGAASLGAAEGLADRLVSFEFADAIERQWAWIAAQASGEWLLWVDDDELPSEALLAELPELVAAEDVTHYQLRRRWVWPSPRETLADPPWEPEFVPRLFRLDPALVTFPGTFHLPLRVTGPFRWVDAPLYHLDLVVNDEGRRREKSLAYERRQPGLRIAGRALNEAFYLPETRSPRTAPVPARDQETLERFLSASPVPFDQPAREPVVEGTRETIDLHYHRAPIEEADYSADLSLRRPVHSMEVGVEGQVEVWVTNHSGHTWRPRGSAGFEVELSYRWRDADGAVLGEGLRTSLPARLLPGESALIVADVEPPGRFGQYSLDLDLVQEHVRWFGAAITTEVTVRPRRRVGILAVDPEPSVRLAALLSERLPELEFVLLTPEDAELRAPYPVERFDGRRHLAELAALVIVGDVRAARKRIRAAVHAARLRGRVRRLPVIWAEGELGLEAALDRLSATHD
jgi:hypothetical protein